MDLVLPRASLWHCRTGLPAQGLLENREAQVIAALYVRTSGAYFNLPGIDPWDIKRDARNYAGPYPVIAHPPCQRWGKMYFGQPLAISRGTERKIKGDDGGCFLHALSAVRKYGGVLEHPKGSLAWKHFGLNEPPRDGGWIMADANGWTCCVEQGRYGHYARKPTWLYAVGVELPELLWGESEARLDPEVVARMGLKRAKRLGEVGAKGGGKDSPQRIGTPPAFRDLLIGMVSHVELFSGELRHHEYENISSPALSHPYAPLLQLQ